MSYESVMPQPDMAMAKSQCGFSQTGLLGFHTHLFFHKLKPAFRQFHAPPTSQTPDLKELEELLYFLPQEFRLTEHNFPAAEILPARLHGTYLQTIAIAYRPCVMRILESNGHCNDPELIQAAKKGIGALIDSTKAYHSLGLQRLLVPNVWVVAHR
jgi:hypothetical protein